MRFFFAATHAENWLFRAFLRLPAPPFSATASGLLWKEIGDSHFERRRQRSDDQQGRISLAALDPADVGPVVLRPRGKLFLAPAALLAEGAKALAEFALDRLHISMKPL